MKLYKIKMDTNQDIITNKAPPILDIKPIEELNEQLDEQKVHVKVHVPEAASPQKNEKPSIDSHDIFVKPSTIKPKRVASEKQKAHMKKLRELKLQKKNRQNEEKLLLKEENERMKREMELLKKQHNLENMRKNVTKPPIVPKRKPERETNNDGNDEMARFMKYMDMYEKHKQAKQPKQAKPQPKQPNPVPKPTPKKNNSSYYVDFLTPQVRYNNYDNPFG